MPETTVHTTCLCGNVKLEATLPPTHLGHCHCDNCRRAHGAGVWTYATFLRDQVRVVTGAEDLIGYTSDTEATRKFCRVCGSTLTYESPRWPDALDLSLANIQEPVAMVPSRHNYADRSPDWCPILDDLPRLGGPDGLTPL